MRIKLSVEEEVYGLGGDVSDSFFHYRLVAVLYFTSVSGSPCYERAQYIGECITVFCELVFYNRGIVAGYMARYEAIHFELLQLVG